VLGDQVKLHGGDWRWWFDWYWARCGDVSHWFLCERGCTYTVIIPFPHEVLKAFPTNQHLSLICPGKVNNEWDNDKCHKPFSRLVHPATDEVSAALHAANTLGGPAARAVAARGLWSRATMKAWRKALYHASRRPI
jgi:hypothetical protein